MCSLLCLWLYTLCLRNPYRNKSGGLRYGNRVALSKVWWCHHWRCPARELLLFSLYREEPCIQSDAISSDPDTERLSLESLPSLQNNNIHQWLHMARSAIVAFPVWPLRNVSPDQHRWRQKRQRQCNYSAPNIINVNAWTINIPLLVPKKSTKH